MAEELETPLRRLRSCPLAIVCGKPEEIPIIAKKLCATTTIPGSSVPGISKSHSFKLGQIEFYNGKTLKFYVTSSLKPGLMYFSISASSLFSILQPRFAIHAGVCAGNTAKGVKLMDVIFGDAAMSFEDGKWAVVNGKIQFQPDYETIQHIITELPGFVGSTPNRHHGAYVSGSAVREDASHIFENIQANVSRNVLALDMEACAFLKICEHYDLQTLGIVKGVSDLGDGNKTTMQNRAQIYEKALGNTGEAILDWVKHMFESMTWEPNEDDEPGAILCGPYYNNFLRLLGDSISRGDHVTSIDQPSQQLQSPVGLTVVMPPDGDPFHYEEQGHIESIARDHGLMQVLTGASTFRRTVYYKKRHIVDFPRTLNTLMRTTEPSYQALVFKRVLQKKGYFRPAAKGMRPICEVLAWEDFVTKFEDTAQESSLLAPLPVSASSTTGLVMTPSVTESASEAT
ncbi:hypothetical protein PV04_08166 [Phialophora macrospora]|uniref:Nucleoside phosphorylase domain-containing protein n=1 Tax=Phialophora macrospora TaxID=1851006 RepID=A0A0D2FD45_9EURO|nr:hypothetical protein PV04_08166 [Phialophora macrospora]